MTPLFLHFYCPNAEVGIPLFLWLKRAGSADAMLNAAEVDVTSEVLKITDAGPDAVLVCVREGAVLNQATQMVRLGGTIALTGFINPMQLDPRIWVEKQLSIKGHISGPVKIALNLMTNKVVAPC
jgi:threonine dehydrogenase-like Zn-dependent dehydrogenase